MIRSFLLFFPMLLGVIFPQSHEYSFLIKDILMLLLFFSFIEINITQKNIFKIYILSNFIASWLIAGLVFFALKLFNAELALVAFVLAITPTATAAPVIIDFLHRNVEYAIASVIFTNCSMALLIPWILPSIAQFDLKISEWELLSSILTVIWLPLILAQLLRLIPRVREYLIKSKVIAFYGWLSVLYLATAKASNFILNEVDFPWYKVIAIALTALMVCIINFSIGRIIGGKDFAPEASQVLGQKNTMFTLWLSLKFLTPVVGLGTIFYIIYQNLYNSYLLSRFSRINRINQDTGIHN